MSSTNMSENIKFKFFLKTINSERNRNISQICLQRFTIESWNSKKLTQQCRCRRPKASARLGKPKPPSPEQKMGQVCLYSWNWTKSYGKGRKRRAPWKRARAGERRSPAARSRGTGPCSEAQGRGGPSTWASMTTRSPSLSWRPTISGLRRAKCRQMFRLSRVLWRTQPHTPPDRRSSPPFSLNRAFPRKCFPEKMRAQENGPTSAFDDRSLSLCVKRSNRIRKKRRKVEKF